MAWSQDLAYSRDLAYSSRKNKLHLSSFHPKILHASFSASVFPRDRTSTSSLPPSSPLYQLGYNLSYISTSFFWSRSPTRLTEPRPSSLLDGRLARKDYLQISAFWIWWWWSKRGFLTLCGKPLEEPWLKWWEDGWPDAVRPDSWDVNISF